MYSRNRRYKGKTMKIGFTGTRLKLPNHRYISLRNELRNLIKEGFNEFHHGDCKGSDEIANKIALRFGYQIVIHPPINSKYRAYCYTPNTIILKELPYLKRNKNIVNKIDLLIAMPIDPKEEILRSGTWATIRYARKKNIPIRFV